MMGYTINTRKKVVDFLSKKKVVILNELLFLGKNKQQIKSSTMNDILHDFEEEGLIRVEKIQRKSDNKVIGIEYIYVGGKRR